MRFSREFRTVERRANLVGLSGYQAAEKAGVARATFWRAKNGACPVASRVRVLDALNAKLGEIEEERKAKDGPVRL